MSLSFSGGHFWVRAEGNEAVLGLSDYLQDQMGEITKLELPDLGDVLRAGLRIGQVESEEASSPLEAPLSGEVLEVNAERSKTPTWSTAIHISQGGCSASGWKIRKSSRS